MSKRFGRNQRRKLRELQIKNDFLQTSASELSYLATKAATENQWLKDKHEQELRQARVARDSIRITVDAILDPHERRTRVMARFDMLNQRRDSLYSAMDVDLIDLDSDIERSSFIKYASEAIADQALGQIVRHWRSR
jgi:hypothetical protein